MIMISFFFFAVTIRVFASSNIFYIDHLNDDPNPVGTESNPLANLSIAAEYANNRSFEFFFISSGVFEESKPIYYANNLSISKKNSNKNLWLKCKNFFGFVITNSSLLKINGINFFIDQECFSPLLFSIAENSSLEITWAVINTSNIFNAKTLFYLNHAIALIETCTLHIENNNNENFSSIFTIQENSLLILMNIFYEINNSKNQLIFSRSFSEIIIKNSTFKNSVFSTGLGVIQTDYFLTIENIRVENVELFNDSLISFDKNNSEELIIIKINNSFFANIVQSQKNQNPLLFISKSLNVSLVLENSLFESNLAYDYFFLLDNSYSNISMTNLIFINNFALGILYFNYGVQTLLTNIIVNSQNNFLGIENNDTLLNYQKYSGTCFKIFNSVLKIINNVTIFNSFSNYTAIGLQIHDTFDQIYIINQNNFIKAPCSMINRSYFGNNFVFYENDQNSSGVFHIHSDFPVFISNSYFYKNIINTTSFPDYKIGAPCVNSFSYSNNLSIESSIFGFNQAKCFSNCLFFKGNVLNITNSYFFSNNPIYDTLELQALANFPSTFTRKVEAHVASNGGAIYSQADYIIINNSYFYNNSNYRGGGLYIEAGIYQKFLFVSIRNTVFLVNQAGTVGGGVDLALSSNLNGIVENCFFLQNDAKYGGGFATEYAHSENYVLVIRSYFCFNTGEYGGGLLAHHKAGKINVTQNLFYNNRASKIPGRTSPISGGSFVIWGTPNTTVNFSHNNHIKNIADINSAVCFIYGGDVTYNNEIYSNNTAFVIAIVRISSQSTVYMYNILMENSFSFDRAGGISINEYSYLYLNNVTIINSSSVVKGGAFLLYENAYMTCVNLTVENSFSNRGSVIMIYENYLNEVRFESSVFRNNSATNSLIDSFFCDLIFYKCEFVENKNSIMILETTKFLLDFSQIFNLSCKSSDCYAISSIESNLTIKNSFIEEIKSDSENAVLISLYSNFSLINLNFVDIFQKKASISIQSSASYIFNVSFLNNFPSSLYSSDSNCVLTSMNFQIKKNVALQSLSFIILVDNPIFEITNSNFLSASAENEGGCINAINQNSMKNELNLIIRNCNFTSSFSKKQGGSLYLLDVTININGCNFVSNIAMKDGGSIFFKTKQENFDSILFINETNFFNNTSHLGGGAIMWVNKIPDLDYSTVTFLSNKASYGDDIASNVLRINIKIFYYNEKVDQMILEHDSFNRCHCFSNYSIKNQKAGYIFNRTLIYNYVDYYNQTVNTLNNRLESFHLLTQSDYEYLFFDQTNDKKNKNADSLEAYILGENAFPIKFGQMAPNNFKIFTKPASNVYFILQSAILTEFSSYIANPSHVELKINSSYNLVVEIEVSQCVLGEIIKENSCFKCDYSEYSLNLDDSTCKKCPEHAICLGGAEIIVDFGYWRSSVSSDNIIYCQESKDLCLGGFFSNCDDLFYGPLCRSCPIAHYNINNQYCVSCSEKEWNILRVIGMIILLFIIIIVLVKSTFDNNKIFDSMLLNNQNIEENENIHLIDLQSFYIKILINWIQLTSLLYILPLSWPDYFTSFLNFFSIFTSLSTKFMAFECIYNEDFGELKPYMKAISTSLIPFALILMTLVFWKIYQKIRKTTDIYDKIYATFIGILIMMQQNILNECINALTCIKIDGHLYLKHEPVYSCESDFNMYMTGFFLWPSFIFWGFALPLLIVGYLYKNKNRLYEAKVFKKFNFLYIGYKSQYYFWDILILLRKSFCILMGLFVGLDFQLMILLMIMFMYFKYQKTCQPFLNKGLNFLEYFASFSIGTGIYITVLISSLENHSEKIGFYVIVLIVNSAFIFTWALFFFVYLVGVYRKFLRKRFPKVLDMMQRFFRKHHFLSRSPTILKGNSWKGKFSEFFKVKSQKHSLNKKKPIIFDKEVNSNAYNAKEKI